MNRRYKINVVEELSSPNAMIRYRARPDLTGAVEGDCPSTARRIATQGLEDDKRFHGMSVVSMSFQNKNTIHVIVKSAHLAAAQPPVYRGRTR